jgi:ubiquinone/menaquinone biosynthesis C-methylase UbiE
MSLSLREHPEALLPPYTAPASFPGRARHAVPHYLEKYYWWAYVRPNAVKFWERQWLINLVLLGNYRKLGAAALTELGDHLPGRTLQISCCYGNFSPQVAERVAASGGTFDVIDILPVQLDNLRRKLKPGVPVRTMQMDATALEFADAKYDRVVLFFLLHEQPADVRARTVREALRVLKPGGTILIVDYAQPAKWHPVRYLLLPILAILEPFAVDLWYHELNEVLPDELAGRTWRKTSYFGGLYQKLVSRG